MSVSADPCVGSDFLGYRIEAVAGRGGMDVVYRAYYPRLKRTVALKLLAPDLAEDERFRSRFLRESELAASLEHPNVVPIHEAGAEDGQLYLAMRLVEGTDLQRVLAREGALEPRRALALCAQVAAALDAAHERSLVHRDVKPSNVLVDAHGHVYLADFGLIRRLTERDDPSRGRTVGSVDYVAPEQIRGGEPSSAADVYSLGCLLFHCLTGEAPYRRASDFAVLFAHLEEAPPEATARNPALPRAIDAVLARALAALDLDHAEDACALLDGPTLEAAGGLEGCVDTVSAAYGIRIHYAIAAAAQSLLGTTIRFSTWADGDAPIRQQMAVSPAGRIVMSVPEPRFSG
jgi:serine/threonine protein kinase